MTFLKTMLGSTALAAGLVIAGLGAASARDLTVVSWGGNYQDAQRKIYFKPFAEKAGKPVLDESWDGGIGVIQAKVKAGTPNWDAVQVEADELAIGCESCRTEAEHGVRAGNGAVGLDVGGYVDLLH